MWHSLRRYADSGCDSGSDSDSDDSIAEESLSPLDAEGFKKIYLLINLPDCLKCEGAIYLDDGKPSVRRGNTHRNRELILEWSNTIEDSMFTRQFRLCRQDFYVVLQKIKPILGKDVQKAMNSSGSSVTPQLMLLITLRILAGASYLDMIHYHVHIDSVNKIFWNTVVAIHDAVDNINLAKTELDCKVLARDWAEIQNQRWGSYLAVGTIYAGDGLVIETNQPSVRELRGRPISIFRNRKGFWGLIAQGFCDAYTRFAVFDVMWPGGTNDIVAYNMSDIRSKAKGNHFPSWATFVLDEAYSSLGGMHLTPYSVHQLRWAKKKDDGSYYKLLAFNNVLSSQRITIERAFGILVRRWGILWRPISYGLAKVSKIARVCAMLHNICVDRWLLTNRCTYCKFKKKIVLPEVPEHYQVDQLNPCDDEVIERMHNNYLSAREKSRDNSLKVSITNHIYDAGIRTHSSTEFHDIQ